MRRGIIVSDFPRAIPSLAIMASTSPANVVPLRFVIVMCTEMQ